jgi:sugar-specific transcriptional regulator TrmB
MTNILEKDLKAIGLKKNESEVYLYILQNGLSTPPQIANGTGIFRTNCYNILQALKEKDVVEEQKKGNRRVYIARDPESLKLSLERRIEAVDRILPDLRSLYTTQKNKPVIRFYDGFEEVKNIYNTLSRAESVYSLGSTEKLRELDPKFFLHFVETIEKNKVIFKDILTAQSKQYSAKTFREIRNSLHQIKFIPEKYMDTSTDILVWEDNIALISLGEPIFGTVITNKNLANTFKVILSIIWDSLI